MRLKDKDKLPFHIFSNFNITHICCYIQYSVTSYPSSNPTFTFGMKFSYKNNVINRIMYGVTTSNKQEEIQEYTTN